MLRYISTLLFLLIYSCYYGQLYTEYSTTSSIDSLVNSVFGSPNVQIFNIQYKADTVQFNSNYTRINDIGYFNSSASTVGFEQGIILTGGELAAPYGLGLPAYHSGTFWKTTPGDSILDLITTPSQTLGAAVIEFDFIPNGDSIKFNYVFASDEYPSQICDEDYDVFAFHISGPGIIGQKNIALIPGTNFPVGNNTVNDTSATIYTDQLNLSLCPTVDYPHLYVNHVGDSTFIFNGSTTVLSAKSATIPCEVYHLRFAVAESNRRGEYSAVFLEANSFNSEPISIESEISYGNGDTLLFEGCGYADVTIKRTYNIQQAKTYTINYSGNAINGADYNLQPLQITMMPGVDTYTLQIAPIEDNIPDNNESIVITVGDTLCNGNYYESSLELHITEKPEYQIQIQPDSGAYCHEVEFYANITGAVYPISYEWNDGICQDSNFYYFPIFNNFYTAKWIKLLTIDACGNSATDSTLINFSHYPEADFYINPIHSDLIDPAINFYDASSPDAVSWKWNFGDNLTLSFNQNTFHAYSDTGYYDVELEIANQFNCIDSIIKTVRINDIPNLYIPNSFTPNGDGINDTFKAYGIGVVDYKIQIFNRWGELVFNADNIDSIWDGINCINGIYSYNIVVSFLNNSHEEFNGFVNLMR